MGAFRSASLSLVVLAASLGAIAPARAADDPPASKTEYLQSGRYAKDVVAAAAPATAWIRRRAAEISQVGDACRAYGLPVGPDGQPTAPTVQEPTAAQVAAAKRAARRARTATREARRARSRARALARRRGASARARRAARRRADVLTRRAARARRVARTTAKAAAPPAIARPAPSACRAIPSKPAVVFDIDETLLSNYIGVPGSDPEAGSLGQFPGALSGTGTRMPGVSDAYEAARKAGFSIFLITARPEIVPGLHDTTIRNLKAAGYPAWTGLSLKQDPLGSSATYKTAERAAIEGRGFRVVANVGDQESDLVGGHAERTFKLPNPFYSG